MTKRDKPAMSEEEFDEAIKELARKEFATGKGMMMLIENCVCSMEKQYLLIERLYMNQA